MSYLDLLDRFLNCLKLLLVTLNSLKPCGLHHTINQSRRRKLIAVIKLKINICWKKSREQKSAWLVMFYAVPAVKTISRWRKKKSDKVRSSTKYNEHTLLTLTILWKKAPSLESDAHYQQQSRWEKFAAPHGYRTTKPLNYDASVLITSI